MVSLENRILSVQILIDSINLYNVYKYDPTYQQLKVFVSKFLDYPTMEICHKTFVPNVEEITTEIAVTEGKSFIFAMKPERIAEELTNTFVDFQTLLVSDDEEKIKSNIHNIIVGYTRLRLTNELEDLIKAVETVSSDNPVIKEIEGAYVIRKDNEQVGTIFLGLRFMMFGSSVSSSLSGANILKPFATHKYHGKYVEEDVNNSIGKTRQVISEITETERAKPEVRRIRYHRLPDDAKDLEREYTYVYSELNGQVIDMKISYLPKQCKPEDMKGGDCI